MFIRIVIRGRCRLSKNNGTDIKEYATMNRVKDAADADCLRRTKAWVRGGEEVMNIYTATFYNLISMLIYSAGIVYVGRVLLKKKFPDRRHLDLFKIILFVLLFFSVAAFGAFLYENGFMALIAVNLGEPYLMMFLNMLLVRMIFGESFRICWGIAVFTYVVLFFAQSVSMSFASRNVFNVGIMRQLIEYLFFRFILSCLVFVAVLFLLHKMNAGDAYRQWMENSGIWTSGMILLSVCPILLFVLSNWFNHRGMKGTSSTLPSASMLIAILFILHYKGREELQRKAYAAQQLNIRQQNAYIETLEGMQEEMRCFRHDFKNMTAGMYLQAKEGGFAEISDFIQEMTDDFESQIGGQIRKMSQLHNVHITEVKGLLLAKLTEMEKEGIACRLEVFAPVESVECRTTDLCRCLGILVDNAMEEVRGHADGSVHIMISCMEEWTTFRVRNTLFHTVDFSKIWESGYSTKGAGRGIGLASYKKILRDYDHVFFAAAVEDGDFIQELRILGRNADISGGK